MTVTPDEDEWGELYDANLPRLDVVGKGANGVPRWLLMKEDASAGQLAPEFVRSLISKTSQEAPVPEPAEKVLPNGITLKGSPAAMAAFIHAASVRKSEPGEEDGGEVAKADLSTKSLNDLPDSAFAYIEPGGKKDASGKTTPRSLRHFAIHDKAHADNAAARIAQGAKFGKEALPKVKAAQKKFGEDVSKEASVPDPVAKDSTPDVPDILAEPDGSQAGDPADPGSPAWEQVDADTAAQWTAFLAGAKAAVQALIDREMTEAATVDPDDAGNACDLQGASDAIDYAIGILAPFAVGEQSEADCGAADLAAIGKAAAGAGEHAQVITGLVSVAKAGRVLSSANEAKIRAAAKSLDDVLASLPPAPDTGGTAAVTKEASVAETKETPADVAKETAPADQQAKDAGPVDGPASDHMGGDTGGKPKKGKKGKVAKETAPVSVYDRAGQLAGTASRADISRKVAKADEKQMMAVFDQGGRLIGVVDPARVQPVSGTEAPKQEAAPDKGAEQPAEAPAPAAPAQPAAPAGPDLQPQPSADAGTPAEDVAKSGQPDAGETAAEDVAKGQSVVDQLREMLERAEASYQEVVAKSAADNGKLAAELEDVRKRLATVEAQPAMPKVALNGAVPPAQLRGQDQGAGPQIDVAKAAERKHRLYTAPTAAEQNEVAKEMQGDAIAALAAIHAGMGR